MAGDEFAADPRVSLKILQADGHEKTNLYLINPLVTRAVKPGAVKEDELATRSVYVNLGCDLAQRSGFRHLTEKHLDVRQGNTVVKARLILICGNQQLPKELTELTAETIILSRAQIDASEVFSLKLTAVNLQLEEENQIASIGLEKRLPPEMSLTALKLVGDGKLDLLAIDGPSK